MQNIKSQNTTSPYSILGIGDIETKDFGRWYGMGSTSIAMSSPYYINASNPASLMTLEERTMIFDLANRGKTAKFMYPSADTFTAITKDFSVRRISLAFKPNKKWAFSIGLKPYSTINYQLSETNAAFSNSSVLAKLVDGSGGLNQLYFSYARSISKNLSVGLTSSYYFGSANVRTEYAGTALSNTLSRQEYNIMSAFQFQFGVQYASKISPVVSQRVGITVSNPATVRQRLETEYFSSDVSIKKNNETKTNFKLPLSAGIGYALIFNNRLTISADAVFNNWEKQRVDYPNSFTSPSARFSTGFEYVNKKTIKHYSYENWYIQAGFNIENNYIKIQHKDLFSYGYTAGFGKNLSRLISVYAGYEFGSRGSKRDGQITEKFNQFILGVTLKEFWFNYRKYGRYQ
ncbi:MAG: hypothetical protein V4685_09760 [Bacteroidota bacterium]